MMLTSGTKDDQSFEATTSGETASGDPDPWAFLGSTEVDARNTTRLVSIQAPTALPDISAIEGPEDLTRRPPYWLFIRQGSNSSVEIKGSHSLTLGLIEKYMKKWCRGNPQVVDRVKSFLVLPTLIFSRTCGCGFLLTLSSHPFSGLISKSQCLEWGYFMIP